MKDWGGRGAPRPLIWEGRCRGRLTGGGESYDWGLRLGSAVVLACVLGQDRAAVLTDRVPDFLVAGQSKCNYGQVKCTVV